MRGTVFTVQDHNMPPIQQCDLSNGWNFIHFQDMCYHATDMYGNNIHNNGGVCFLFFTRLTQTGKGIIGRYKGGSNHCGLLGCEAMLSCMWLPMFRRNISHPPSGRKVTNGP